MNWKRTINETLSRTTGLELRRTGAVGARRARRRAGTIAAGDRLLARPAFILSTVRSGSTLLRVLLDSHSEIHSPHEMHLRDLAVSVKSKYAEKALDSVGLDSRHLEYLLWDRVLHRELAFSGKSILVNKTPSDVFVVDRILECWPDARFIFLLRHPAAVAASRHATRPQDSEERNVEMVLRYGNALEQARRTHPGITVRYEDIANDPVKATKDLCAFLEVPWEPGMVDYGRHDHGKFRAGLGDWKDKIKSGQVQPPTPPPPFEEIHERLRPLCVAWGYPPAPAPAPSAPAEG